MAVSFTQLDLQFILQQILMAETNTPPANPSLSFGIRQVAGTNNNSTGLPGTNVFGASDQPFSQAAQQLFQTVTVNVDGTIFDPNPLVDGDTMTTTYAQNLTNTNNPIPGIVVDTAPRVISNIISDVSANNPAAVDAAQAFGAQLGDGYTVFNTNPTGITMPGADGVFGTPDDILPVDPNNLFVGNITPDAGLSAPFNSWMTYFGQFFDHGLDLITKGGQGTVFIPLLPDDPLYNPAPGAPNFMVLTRATTTLITGGADGIIGDNLATTDVNEGADDVHKFINEITPFVDQNQTYTSHPSHQVFLREYARGVDGLLHTTGKLLQHAEGPDGVLHTADDNTGMATWADLKVNAAKLGIVLSDYDVGNVPQLVTDAYGNFIRGPAFGGVQVVTAHGTVEMNPAAPSALPADTIRIGVAFINDMAHDASPFNSAGAPLLADADGAVGIATIDNPYYDATYDPTSATFNPANVSDFHLQGTAKVVVNPAFQGVNPIAAGNPEYLKASAVFDDELLDAHYVAGDGRVNENIALTTVHEIFHSEHNRLVDQVKGIVQAALAAGNVSFAQDWVLAGTVLTPGTAITDAQWNGERVFQAAKFGTETQYQHLVFEEFARKVAPAIHVFGNVDIHLDPAIMSEFANAVYRFGHSMLDENVPLYQLNADGSMKIDTVATLDAHVTVPVVTPGGALFEGTAGSDVPLQGDGFNDNQFVAGGGDDLIIGGSGSDTYFYNSATDGSDVIVENGSFDRIVLTGAETASDIEFSRNGDDLDIHFKTADQHIFVSGFMNGGDAIVEQIIFHDGTYIDLTDGLLQNAILASTPATPVTASLAQVANPNFGQALMSEMGLIDAFTNPLAYAGLGATGAAQIVQGNTHQIGSEIDEFVTGALRNNLLGLPLDLAALNIARGRDTGVSPLNLVRNQIFAATNDQTLKPYDNWAEFSQFLKHQASLVNFVAAYGTHAALQGVTSVADKRLIAAALITDGLNPLSATADISSGQRDAWDFMHSQGLYANDVNNPIAVHAQWSTGSVTGLDSIDLWIGGLAEKQNLFGGLLGSTFNFIFETQLENLQDADRLYYLPRIEGTDFGLQIESNTFASLIIANTGAKHLSAAIFNTPEYTVEAGSYFRKDIANFDANLFHVDAQGFVVSNASGVRVATDSSTWLHNPVSGAALVEVLPDGTVHFIGDDNFFGNTMVLGGTEGDDRLQAGHADDDTVWGDGGNDWMDGGNGNDNLFGGDGNDTMVDSAGLDIFHGGAGNDHIFGGLADDIIFGDDGNDYIETGPADIGDAANGGAGNDIIIGGDGDDTLQGDQGDDWIEGGVGGDGLIGDTGAPTGQVPLYAANDVLDGGANGDKMTGFSGDDIMLGEGGFDKFLGRLGFDWADFEKETSGVTIDMERRLFIPNAVTLAGDAVRDFFIETEASSGTKFNDTIYGTEDAGGPASVFNELTNLELIQGLSGFFANGIAANFANAPNGAVPRNPVGYNDGNILLGGDGSDTIIGRAGNDIIDGDAYLHVELTRDKFGNIGPDSQIVRQILFDTTPGDIDTAVYRDVMANYTINLVPDAEGFITISHNSQAGVIVGGIRQNDGTDKIRNIERLQFLDQTINVDPSPNANRVPTGALIITDDDANPATPVIATVGAPLTIDLVNSNVSDPDGIQPGSIQYHWEYQVITPGGGTQWLPAVGGTGTTFTPTNAQLGTPIRAVETFIDNKGWTETVYSIPTALAVFDPNINTAPFLNPQQNPVGVPDTTATTTAPVSYFIPLTIIFSDHETLSANLTYTAFLTSTGFPVTANPAANPLGLTFTVQTDGAGNVTGALVTGPVQANVGSINITVKAADPAGLAVTDSFLINVVPGNQPPVTAAAVETFVGSEDGVAVGHLLNGSDPDNGPSTLGYQINGATVQNGSVAFDNVTHNYVFTPSPELSSNDLFSPTPPVFSFQYRVTDGLAFSAWKTVTGTINAADDGVAPVTITGTAASGGTLSALIGVDPDGPWISGSESYQWFKDGVAINGATGVDLLLTDADINHTFTVQASYTDGQGFSYSGANAINSDNSASVGFIGATGVIGGGAPPKIQLLNNISDPDAGVLLDSVTVTYETSTDNVNWTLLDPLTSPTRFTNYIDPLDGLTKLVFLPLVTGAAGAYVRVSMTYIDGLGNLNEVGGTSTHYIVDTTAGNPNLNGTAASELIFGNGGADVIRAGAGDDFAQGENGADTFFAQIGDGNDTYDGGNGIDTYNMNATNAPSTVNLANHSATSAETGVDVLWFIENVTGSAGANDITGDDKNNTINGLAGNDLLNAGTAGTDTLNGGDGNDTFVVDHVGVTVTETNAAAAGGIDLVQSAITFTLGTNVENLTLTGSAAINGTGNGLDNLIIGNAAANVIDGGATGNDALLGGDGNDTYTVSHAGVSVVENFGEGIDLVNSAVSFTINQYVENLTLTGTAAINGTGNDLDNVITGNTGANILDAGAAGNDTLVGGTGNDTYIISHAGVVITEAVAGGTDTVQAAISYDLGASAANVENLTLTGTAVLTGTGNAGANTMTGNAAASTLIGGDGNDTYVVSTAGTVVSETSATGGTDLVQSGVTFTLGTNVENLTLTGAANIDGTGNAGVNTIIGNTGANRLDGAGGADNLQGGTGNDTYVIRTGTEVLTDTGGTDTVETAISFSVAAVATIENVTLTGSSVITGTGNTGTNVMTGNSAASTLDGGSGNDTYVISNGATVIVEAAAGGTDLVQSSATYTLATNVENLTLTGAANIDGTGNAGNNTITGNAGNNLLSGGGGTDTLAGGDGNDTYVVATGVTVSETNATAAGGVDLVQSSITFTLGANFENLTLAVGAGAINATGNTLANVLTGNESANIFSSGGGAGLDTYIGGDGNDTYNVAVLGTVVLESNAVSATGGIDLVNFSSTTVGDTYTLGANVENLTLTGTAAINGTGNTLANTITGNTGANTLNDGGGATGGVDTLIGLAGNDVYVISSATTVTTEAAAAGTDTVDATFSVDLTLLQFANIENAILHAGAAAALNLTGTTGVNTLTGNEFNNLITSGGGADILNGGAGDDTYVITAAATVNENVGEGTDLVQSSVTFALGANIENLTLTGAGAINGTGNVLSNVITGNGGNNILSDGGGAGIDTLIGGLGSDTFVITNAAAITTEAAAGGTDTVDATFSIDLTLAQFANIENATLHAASAAALNLTGTVGNNTLTGNEFSNLIIGNGGADILVGGLGDDTYVITSTSTITEAAGAGTDTVQSSITLTLGANLENLTLTGAAAINGTGNAGANVIIGNSANNVLTGGTGVQAADTFTGGLGNDTFVFNAVTGINLSHITDFSQLVGTNRDLMQLTAIDANSVTAGDQNFTFVAAAFTAGTIGTLADGAIGWYFDGVNTHVVGNIAGTVATNDFDLILDGNHPLTSADFVLTAGLI